MPTGEQGDRRSWALARHFGLWLGVQQFGLKATQVKVWC